MTLKTKRILLIIAFGVLLNAAVLNIDVVVGFFKSIFSLCLPLFVGLILAFVINAPMRGFEKLIDKISFKFKKKMLSKIKYPICLFLSLLLIVAVLVGVFTVAVPRIKDSVESVIQIVDEKIPEFLIFLEKNDIDTTYITDKLSNFDVQTILKNIASGAVKIVVTAVDASKAAFQVISTLFFAIIISVYLLLDKDNVSRHCKKFCRLILPEKAVDYIYHVAYLVRDTFAKFLSGQCFEALALGVLIFVLFTIFKLPYAGLIAILAAVLSFVPYVGSFIACAVGVLLTLIVSPSKVLICLVVYLAAQLIEQHLIYPHVVGNSVGLSPLYTIIAVLIGGSLFGVFGMLFFIPLFSVIITLIKEYAENKNKPTVPHSKEGSEEPSDS